MSTDRFSRQAPLDNLYRCFALGLPLGFTLVVWTKSRQHGDRGWIVGWILLVVLLVLIIGGAPMWPYSREWGYAPSGLLGVALVIVLVLVLAGYIPQRL